MINDCGKTGIIIDHNSAGTGCAAGTRDIPAGVWGMFNMKNVENQPTLRTLQSDKLREGDPFMWQLELLRQKGLDGSDEGWHWRMDADLSFMAVDLTWRQKFIALLRLQQMPITFQDAGRQMHLEDKEFQSIRKSVSGDGACMRWAEKKTAQSVATTFWMPLEMRGPMRQGESYLETYLETTWKLRANLTATWKLLASS